MQPGIVLQGYAGGIGMSEKMINASALLIMLVLLPIL
jgi:hypothetical protein